MGLLTTTSDHLTVKVTNTKPAMMMIMKTSSPQKISSWKMARDVSLHRKHMRKAIALILQPRMLQSGSTKTEFIRTIHTFESCLFERALSLGAYLDRTSLRRRLRQVQEEQETTAQQQQSQQGDATVDGTFLRRRLQRRILQLLQAKQQQGDNNNNSSSVLLQHMSRKLEVSLFRSAQQPQEYSKLLQLDNHSLQHRLMQLLQQTSQSR
mmetsp:Transcript_20032/g.43102  ORF Transcript_20032/g.43102 Transcript_20032/m.43102 type:complete len:209 (+) Transcript_20032:104-730(+)